MYNSLTIQPTRHPTHYLFTLFNTSLSLQSYDVIVMELNTNSMTCHITELKLKLYIMKLTKGN